MFCKHWETNQLLADEIESQEKKSGSQVGIGIDVRMELSKRKVTP